ncbi:MAG: 3-oxoacyl-[acyl-carrier-protein] reductase [Deltaproteobacteria bacterium]|nr:3-oxoacyl-[acyl-carrier-protein] reductase [Deltaproteobacteria bacterium]
MYKGKLAVITGAFRGIGRVCAEKLAKSGVKVVINDVYNEEQAERVKEEVEKSGGICDIMMFDISNYKETEEGFAKIVEKWGNVDYLVNNAGIVDDNLILRMKPESFKKVIDVNLIGAFNCTKQVVRGMIKQKFGVIVSIASIVGLSGNAGQCNYAASKAGIVGFTKSLAKELASKNIRANAVAPGFIETIMTKKIPAKDREKLIENIPLSRLGKPEDIANAVAFLLSEEASYITGTVINVSGGLYI